MSFHEMLFHRMPWWLMSFHEMLFHTAPVISWDATAPGAPSRDVIAPYIITWEVIAPVVSTPNNNTPGAVTIHMDSNINGKTYIFHANTDMFTTKTNTIKEDKWHRGNQRSWCLPLTHADLLLLTKEECREVIHHICDTECLRRRDVLTLGTW